MPACDLVCALGMHILRPRCRLPSRTASQPQLCTFRVPQLCDSGSLEALHIIVVRIDQRQRRSKSAINITFLHGRSHNSLQWGQYTDGALQGARSEFNGYHHPNALFLNVLCDGYVKTFPSTAFGNHLINTGVGCGGVFNL